MRFAVGARTNAGNAAGATDHFLRERVTLAGVERLGRAAEQRRCAESEGLAGALGEAPPDDQVDTTAGTHLVEQYIGFQFELGQQFAAFGVQDASLVGTHLDHITHAQLVDRRLEHQCSGIFHRVEKNRRNLAADAQPARALVRHARHIVAEIPQHRVGGGFAARAGADHIAHKGDGIALLLQLPDQSDRADAAVLIGFDAVAAHLEHRQRVQRNIGPAPGIGCRREIVGIGFAAHLEHGAADRLGHGGAAGEPFAFCPGFQHLTGMHIAGLVFFDYIVESIEHQQGALQLCCRERAELGIVERGDQGCDVVATEHVAEQLDGPGAIDQRAADLAVHDGAEKCCLHIRGFVHARRHPVADQVEQEGFLAGRRVLQQFDQLRSPLGTEGLGYDALGCTFLYMFTISFEHGFTPRW